MVPVSGRVRVTAYDFEPAVEAGDVVRIHHLRLRQPSGFRNPGAFDYGRYLARRGIYATGSLSKNEQIEVVQHSSSVLLKRFAQFKSHLAGRIAAAMDADEAAITTEMALGVRSALPPQVREAFNASGTVHLLSVSGFHVAAVYGAVFFLLRFLIKQVRFRLLGRCQRWATSLQARRRQRPGCGDGLCMFGHARRTCRSSRPEFPSHPFDHHDHHLRVRLSPRPRWGPVQHHVAGGSVDPRPRSLCPVWHRLPAVFRGGLGHILRLPLPLPVEHGRLRSRDAPLSL